jgi:hypothetical protein
MKKLNTQGFAHQVLVLAVVVIAVIGGIGSYIYLHKSSASINYASVCGSGYKWITSSIGSHSNVMQFTNTSTKNVCFLLVSKGKSYGVVKPMSLTVKLTKDSDKNGSWAHNTVVSQKSDSGNYKYYAGPFRFSYKGLDMNMGHVGAYSFIFSAKSTYNNYTDKHSGLGQGF